MDNDLVYLAAAALFFLLTGGLVRLCAAVRGDAVRGDAGVGR